MKSTLKKRWGRIALCLCMANFACAGMAQTNKKLDDQVINTMKFLLQTKMEIKQEIILKEMEKSLLHLQMEIK